MAKKKRTSGRKRVTRTKGLTPQLFSGLSKKRMKKSTGTGVAAIIKTGSTIPVQFLQKVEDFVEYDNHNWREGKDWIYVPCAGDKCPLCDDESDEISKKTYRFATNVYNLEARKVQVLEGPKTLARLIYHRYDRNPAQFQKRVYEVTKLATQPISYIVDRAEEERTVATKGLKLHDLEEYVLKNMQRYYGDEMPAADADDDLDEDEDEDEDDEDENGDEENDEEEDLSSMSLAELREKAEEMDLATSGKKSALIERIEEALEEDEEEEEEDDDEDTDDEEDEDESDDEEDDDWDEDLDDDEDEDEEEEKVTKKKSSKKKKSAKKSTTRRKSTKRRGK